MEKVFSLYFCLALTAFFGSSAYASVLPASPSSDVKIAHLYVPSYNGEVVVKIKTSDEAKPIYLTTVVNGTPSVFNDIHNISYVANVTKVGNSPPTPIPGNVGAGTIVEVNALTTPSGTIVLHYDYEHTKLLNMNSQAVGGLKVQLPDISTFSHIDTLAIRPGQRVNVEISSLGQKNADSVTMVAELVRSE